MKKRVAIRFGLVASLSMGFVVQGRPESETEQVKRIAVKSSIIASAGYGAKGKSLDIEFRTGAVYRYVEVPPAVYAAFIESPSKGRYFGAQIRGKYSYEKLKGPRP